MGGKFFAQYKIFLAPAFVRNVFHTLIHIKDFLQKESIHGDIDYHFSGGIHSLFLVISVANLDSRKAYSQDIFPEHAFENLVSFLLDAGLTNEDGLYAALEAAIDNGYVEIAHSLLRLGIASKAALESAARNDHIEIVKLLLSAGIRSEYALAVVAGNGDIESVKIFLIAGIRGEDALGYAAPNGHIEIEIVKLLLDAGIRSARALTFSASNGHIEIVKLLLNAGITSRYALRDAAAEGHTEIVALLEASKQP